MNLSMKQKQNQEQNRLVVCQVEEGWGRDEMGGWG